MKFGDKCFFCRKNPPYQIIHGKPVCIDCALPYRIGLKEGKDDAIFDFTCKRLDGLEMKFRELERELGGFTRGFRGDER